MVLSRSDNHFGGLSGLAMGFTRGPPCVSVPIAILLPIFMSG